MTNHNLKTFGYNGKDDAEAHRRVALHRRRKWEADGEADERSIGLISESIFFVTVINDICPFTM